MHLPVGIRGPSEDKAAGDELWDDSGTKALRSSEQSGLASSFSILAHYFPTSSASFHTLEADFNSLLRSAASTPATPKKSFIRKVSTRRASRAPGESFRVTGGTVNCEWPRARLNQSDAAFTCRSEARASECW